MAGFSSEPLLVAIVYNIYHEYRITESLLRSNAGAVVVSILSAILPRLFLPTIPIITALELLLKTFILSIFYLYSFDIVNQTTGVAEDTINKPYRPIVSGLVTLQGTQRRWALIWVLSPLLAFWLSGVHAALWAFLWQIEVGFCYVWPRFNNPVMRNVFIFVGTFILVSFANAIFVEQYQDRNLHTVLRLTLAAWTAVVSHLQEFHDVEGDRVSGKRTLPVVLGQEKIWIMRHVTGWIFFIAHAGFLWWGLQLAPSSVYQHSIHAVGVIQFKVGMVVGLRVVRSSTVEVDKSTYYYWFIPLFWLLNVYISLLGTAM
jgi:4-hydroxybenzoate polyprenyltransferase